MRPAAECSITEARNMNKRPWRNRPRPTFIEADLPVDLPAPRDQIESKELPEFARVRSDVYRRIRRSSEAMRTASTQTVGS